MPARELSEQLKVKSLCSSSSWDEMIGNDQVRFCEHCSLRVHNISQLTPKRVRALVAKTHVTSGCSLIKMVLTPSPALMFVGHKSDDCGQR